MTSDAVTVVAESGGVGPKIVVADPDTTEPASADQPRRKRRIGKMIAALAVLGLVGAGAWFAYPRLTGTDDDAVATDASGDATSEGEPTTTSSTTAAPTTTAPSSTSSTATTVAETTTTTAATTTTQRSELLNVACSTGGDAQLGSISGVQDWATMRSGPQLDASEVALVPRTTELAYFPDSVRQGPRFSWVEVYFGNGCGWIADKFIKQGNGRVFGRVTAVDYVHRALRGLEPEALHATEVSSVAGDLESPLVPFDDSSLASLLVELRQLDVGAGPMEAMADESTFSDPSVEQEGCEFGDILHCRVEIFSPNGVLVTAVIVSYAGDGVTFAAFD